MLNGEPAFNHMELSLQLALVPPALIGNVSRSDLLPFPPRCTHQITPSKIHKHISLGLGEQSERKVITKYATSYKHTYIYHLPYITKLHIKFSTILSLSSLPYEIGSEMSRAFVTKLWVFCPPLALKGRTYTALNTSGSIPKQFLA